MARVTEEAFDDGTEIVRVYLAATLTEAQSVERALAQDSQFSQVLRDPRAKDATITIWTYPDSFDAFRQIKKELYRMGFAVAARPLHEGASIGFSPEGTKSAAE